MFKVLLIVFAFFFLLFRVGGFFMKLLFGGMQAKQNQPFQKQSSQNKPKPKDGNVHIEHVPDNLKKGDKGFDGGDYIDYEEVK